MRGESLPVQTVFHPRRCLYTDKVKHDDLILTVSITPILNASNPHDLHSIAAWVPSNTIVFDMANPTHRRYLREWLSLADTLVGQNILFDLLNLRSHPDFRYVLDGRHTIIDLMVLNFLHFEGRPEKSLKDLGPLLNLYTYDEDLLLHKHGNRYPYPNDAFRYYNACDTHNTTLACAEIARRIIREYPKTLKLSTACIDYYNSNIYACLRMAEAGIPFDLDALATLESSLLARSKTAEEYCHAYTVPIPDKEPVPLVLKGDGSNTSQYALMEYVCHTIDVLATEDASYASRLRESFASSTMLLTSSPTSGKAASATSTTSSASSTYSILSHPLLQYTPTTKKISNNELNRALLRTLLDPTHPLVPLLNAIDEYETCEKLVSSYTFPLLRHKRNFDPDAPPPKPKKPKKGAKETKAKKKKSPYASICLPYTPSIGITYPTFFIVRSESKDSGGALDSDIGGQRQGRPSAQDPGAQTFPPSIKKCMTSRWGERGVIHAADLSQIELRVAGVLSGERTLIAEYAKPKPDLHTARAIYVFGPDVVNWPGFKSGDVSEDPRQWSKKFNFEDLYLAGALKMQHILFKESGVLKPLSFFKAVVASRPHLRPDLCEWQARMIATARKQGYLELPFFGQSRMFPGISKINEIVNMPIQMTAANVLWQWKSHILPLLPSLNDPRPWAYLINNVHDAIYFDVLKTHLPRLQSVLAQSFATLTSTIGYWHRLCTHYGNFIPCVYEETKHEERKAA